MSFDMEPLRQAEMDAKEALDRWNLTVSKTPQTPETELLVNGIQLLYCEHIRTRHWLKLLGADCTNNFESLERLLHPVEPANSEEKS